MNELRCTNADGVLRLVLNRPQTGNALSPGLVEALINALAGYELAPPKHMVLNGEGRNFLCAIRSVRC